MRYIFQNILKKIWLIFRKKSQLLSSALALAFLSSSAQDTVKYIGTTLSNIDYHHGQLKLIIGIHNIQVMRANRENPEEGDGFGWTYNHAPMLAYWNNTFFLEYLSDSIGEHIPPSQTLLVTSKNGYNWSKPKVIFPPYKIPDGTVKEGESGVTDNLFAIMHQRMGFYICRSNRLLVFAYYGICMHSKDSPNDGKGIGRVVREVYADGSFGPIYFIRYNKVWNEKNTSFPYYEKSKDKGFVDACNEILSIPLMMQQWNEESDRDDPLIPINKEYKAFNFYHLPNDEVVGFWKHALTSISNDEGRTWQYNPCRAPGFVNGNAKIWGQKTSDGNYITVYNPSEFRWPLALSVSSDGLVYENLLLVNGEISTMRYGGNYKSYGPQYVRGIIEGNGIPPDNNFWITYSMNKEDIWIAKIPIPVSEKVEEHLSDVFNEMSDGKELNKWNIYSSLWAPVSIEKSDNNKKYLVLKDWDRYDYAKAERIIPSSDKLIIEMSILPSQNNCGRLEIELQDMKGTAAIRLIFDSDSLFKTKAGYRYPKIMNYEKDQQYNLRIEANTGNRSYNVFVNGVKKVNNRIFFAPVHSIERIVFRTGEVRYYPNANSPAYQDFDVPQAGEPSDTAVFLIESLKTSNL